MIFTVPNSFGTSEVGLMEVNRCHGKGRGHPCGVNRGVGSGKKAESIFYFPKDFKKNIPKYTTIAPTKDLLAISQYGWVDLSKLKSALYKNAGPVKDMIKVIKSGVKFAPLTVLQTKSGKWEVEDGNTRVAALQALGYTGRVPALVFPPRDGGPTKRLERWA